MSMIMGFGDAPVCLSCLATRLRLDRADLRDSLIQWIARRDCYHGAWVWAGREEQTENQEIPGCLSVPEQPALTPRAHPSRPEVLVGSDDARFPNYVSVDAIWDAGDMGCGELVLQLRMRLKDLAAGQVMKLTAQDPGAREDLPAWCRLTGHTLLRAEHPDYWIRRKE